MPWPGLRNEYQNPVPTAEANVSIYHDSCESGLGVS
jgi:hypothetical protein